MCFYKKTFLFFCITTLVLQSYLYCNADDMPAVYEADVAGDDFVDAPKETIKITVDFTNSYLTISPDFYGINIHPVPASWAFRNKELVANLKPDVIRIMASHRKYWLRDADDETITLSSTISPVKGVYDFTELDALISNIISIGAKPYITLGFGAPSWMGDKSGPSRFHRVVPEKMDEYAEYMAEIVKHVNNSKSRANWITIDNEPENLEYSIEDYIRLAKIASKYIKTADPEVKICGPVTGYATWKQPNGKKLSFSSSMQMLRNAGLSFDMIDWHIYATNPQLVLNCIDTVKRIWSGKPMVISELNRDWRYSGKGGETSKLRNTNWRSVAWLAYLYDQLQRKGVSQVHYFCLGNNYFGLYDYHQTKVNPNYFLFTIMTNLMGRERVVAESDNKAIGVIATVDKNSKTILIYNRSDSPVKVNFDAQTSDMIKVWDYNKSWYMLNRSICDGSVIPLLPKSVSGKTKTWTVSTRGVLVFKY